MHVHRSACQKLCAVCALPHPRLIRLKVTLLCCNKWYWYWIADLAGWASTHGWLMGNRNTCCWEPACCLIAAHSACCRMPSSSPGTTAMTVHCYCHQHPHYEAAVGVCQHAFELGQTHHMYHAAFTNPKDASCNLYPGTSRMVHPRHPLTGTVTAGKQPHDC